MGRTALLRSIYTRLDQVEDSLFLGFIRAVPKISISQEIHSAFLATGVERIPSHSGKYLDIFLMCMHALKWVKTELSWVTILNRVKIENVWFP